MSDDIEKRSELLEFPCRFPIKIMGREDVGIRETAMQIVNRHAGPIADSDVRVASSRKGNFVSVTVFVEAQSQQQLDAIYQDLTDNEDVLFSL